jgi:hypothetical protein
MNINYVYLLQEREFINSNIIKIGKTKQENLKRFKSYPKGSILLVQKICSDCDVLERDIIDNFKNNFNHRKDIGNEYFEGSISLIINLFEFLINKQGYNSCYFTNNENIINSFEVFINNCKNIIIDKDSYCYEPFLIEEYKKFCEKNNLKYYYKHSFKVQKNPYDKKSFVYGVCINNEF